jgi:hypothetical protein
MTSGIFIDRFIGLNFYFELSRKSVSLNHSLNPQLKVVIVVINRKKFTLYKIVKEIFNLGIIWVKKELIKIVNKEIITVGTAIGQEFSTIYQRRALSTD